MGVLLLEEIKQEREQGQGEHSTLRHPLFNDPKRRERTREMILQKRGGGPHGRW